MAGLAKWADYAYLLMGLLIPYIRKRYIDKDDDKEVLTCPICKNKYPKQIGSCLKCGLGR